MGSSSSKSQKLEKALGNNFPDNEHFFGLENFGNTCYCNSVLQALYYCAPFRDQCLNYCRTASLQQNHSRSDKGDEDEDDLLLCLCELFLSISSQKKRCGVYAPRKFIHKLREANELFRSHMHQDAHEFLNFLLNEVAEILEQKRKKQLPNGHGAEPKDAVPKTWVHEIFAGTLTNETKCLCCETVTSKDEMFLDLSLDIEQNTSVSACLRNFSSTESLRNNDKFFCDKCCGLQEAQKRMRIKKLPNILALHLKRFKYIEQLQRYKKLSYRVVFPLELKVTNVSSDATDCDRKYDLFAVVIHVGSGPNHGHYISIIKSHNRWLLFDDETVELIDESNIQSCFGSTQDIAQNTDAGYILFYQSRSWNGVESSASATR